MKTGQPETRPSLQIIIVYDSVFGNTEKIAQAIRDGFLELKAECRLIHASEANNASFEGADLLIIGSPTRAFRPTPLVCKKITDKLITYEGRTTASFDTRIDVEDIKSKFLRYIIGHAGYAALWIEDRLKFRKAIYVGEPAAFFVTASEGPLRRGETDRAFLWAKNLFDQIPKSK